jgi:hypothetical protein
MPKGKPLIFLHLKHLTRPLLAGKSRAPVCGQAPVCVAVSLIDHLAASFDF